MSKTLHGFNFSTHTSQQWANADTDLSISNEGLGDFIADKLSPSYNDSDIKQAKEALTNIEKVLQVDLKVNELIVLLDDKQSILNFYTKKGRVISSFPVELERQAKSIAILESAINKISTNISRLDVNADEFTILGELNDSELMPIFNKISMLSFLGGVYIDYTQNKKIDDLKVRSTDYANKVNTKRKSLAGAWLKGFVSGTLRRSNRPLVAIGTVMKLLKFPKRLALGIGVTAIAASAIRAAKASNRHLEAGRKHNALADKNFFDIVEASQISPGEFESLSKRLEEESKKLLSTIEKFSKVDEVYKESNDKLLRDMLRNARILSSIGLKVLNVQGKFYKHILKN